MATCAFTTPLRVTEPPAHFMHSIISQNFTRLNASLALYIECERDLEQADCFDLAFTSWAADAERARAEVLERVAQITIAPVERPSDLPLKRAALLTRALIESESAEAFTSLYRLLDSYAHLFACRQHGAVGARVRQMLQTCHCHLEALAELGEFTDPGEGWDEAAPEASSLPKPLACAH
ncbi:hypothetical protein JMM61_19530 [Rhodovulum sulfidophilum]|uniref:hypothetical protein n=1 Tax=Rhodovulum sulfidophilum TaxID=35806 RepID=UPI0019297158|nr:hypothetical protein [Rhodovulum sulfidophilum]MBL3587528.1 hypothetical protein [Rhodovulum sulfidophilum]